MADAPTTPYAIEVIDLVKEFRVRHAGGLKQAVTGLARPSLRASVEQKRSLKGISFSVPHGETVAVVGRNGSGKSTLLGLLARVYKPTSGEIRLSAPGGGLPRVAPLLALGAGFHPDLTGYDNVTFYAAVMGLSGRELKAKLPDIVAFAEIEDKMDARVRGWNDGARLRLGFSAAVHTDPDLLLVDEVLAVGDEAFQNKCYRLIAGLQEQGKTILFVSHDLSVVERVASRVIWLHEGVVRMDGGAQEVLAEYRAESR